MAAARILSQKYGAPIYGHSHVVETGHADTALEDGSIVSLSGMSQFAVRVIHTPGHHPGHLSFWEENTQTLFCGDLAANPGTILVDPNTGGDMTEYLASLQRLSELEPRLTVPAHGAPLFGKDGTDLFHKTAAHRLWRESKIAEAIDAGASTIDDILDRAYADTPAFLRKFAVRQLKAHLKRLKFVPPHTPDE
jgi:glyoxylase-like metal-dependent hydrolase (beta-lactamase superfamily II)